MPRIELRNGYLDYQENFLTDAEKLLPLLKTQLDWYQGEITLFGKRHQIPRLQCWYGEKAYTYSGVTLPPTPVHPLLLRLLEQVNQASEHAFNSILGNWYQHGKHSMGFHADNEPELGAFPKVSMLTFGQARPLVFKHTNGKDTFRLEPTSGSLLIMGGELQHYWKHGINKSRTHLSDRITLTFRTLLSQ